MAVISKDLGAVTAYAAAVNRGYTGTREEFETLMASYAYVGEQAAESASNASQSATDASQSAQNAETAKGTAQQAATDAQTAQASAQGYARSAQQSAQSASQYAQNAESAKNTAVNAVDGFAAGAQQALDSVNQAGVNWKSLAQAHALDSEAYALGTRDGEDVGAQDATYHNNAKWYAEHGGASAQTATEAAQTATIKASEAQASAEAAAESARTLTIDRTLTQSGQAADAKKTGDEIASLKEDFDSVFVTTKGKNLFNKSAVLENKYCNVNGVISDYNGRYVTDYIPVEAGKIVTPSYLNNATQVQTPSAYSSICCYDSTKAVVSGGNINQYTFTVPNGVAFVRITFASNMYVYDGMVELTDDGVPTAYEPYTGDSVSLSEDITIQTGQVIGLESRLTTDENNITSIKDDLDGILDTDIIFDQSGFIRYDGVLAANSNYISTDFVNIAVNGTFVKYKYRLRMFANTKIAYYNDSKVCISVLSPSESSALEYVEGEVPYVDGAKYVRFCTASGITDYYVKYATVKNAVIGGANDSNPCNYTGNDMSVFNKILCIGDSLTSGTFNYRVGNTTGNYIEDAKYSYPTYLKKLTGCETTNMGNGGRSSAEWYNAHKNDDLSGYDCAIIQLGVNDCIRYTTWGETSETAFTNIINKLKTENKNIKIFVANIIPATSYANEQYLAFSADLLAWVESTYVSDANVIPLDMQQYGHTKDSPAYNCGHLSALGYRRLAQDYKGYIGWYINQNKTVFKEIQFIGTDYYYDPI